jgi:putative ABC transport system permease protein
VWRATVKSLFARKVRLALTALSIVLGVGFVAGTFVLTDTMGKAFDDLFKTASSGSDVVVRATSAFAQTEGRGGGGAGNERDPVPDSLLPEVRAVPGVAAVSGGVSGYAQMIDPVTGKAIGGVGPPTLGVNWTTTNPSIKLRSGSPPGGPTEVVVDAATASKYHLKVGDRITILFQGPSNTYTIVGIAGFGTADNLAGATVAFFDTATAQDVLGKKGVFDEIDVVAASGIEATDLRSRVSAVLPKGVEAVTSATVADELSKAVKDGLSFFRTALLVFAFIALFVGAFIIFNTFTIIVAQRMRELALLRALGASRRQIMTSVVGEALVVGVFASLVGIVAGVAIAVGLKGLLKAFGVDLPSTSLQIRPRTIVVSILVGCIVTAIASILPARRASKVAPVEAMRETSDGAGDSSLRRRLLIGLAVTAIGVAMLLTGLFGHPSNAAALVGGGAAVVFIGIAALAPIISRPVASVLGAPIARLGVHGKLGRQNAMRSPRRTAAAASALMIGLGLVAMVSILSASLKASFDAVLQKNLKADLILTTSSFTSFSPQVASKVSQVPGVGAASEIRQAGFRVGSDSEFLSAIDPATIDQVTTLGLSEGASAALTKGDLVVLDKTAAGNGWKVGDQIPAAFSATGDHPLRMGGTFTENRVLGSDYIMSLSTYESLFPEQLDSFVMVKLAPGADPVAVTAAIKQATKDFGNIQVEDQAAFRAKQAGFVDQLLGLVTALLSMAVVIALFGIANTLGLSIFERRRELGLLRAVGMSRRQVKRMIRWESVIIAVLGATLGIAVGIFFGWALQSSLADQGITELVIPIGQMAFYLIFAALSGVLAAIWPARRAARLDVLEAISYE